MPSKGGLGIHLYKGLLRGEEEGKGEAAGAAAAATGAAAGGGGWAATSAWEGEE